MCDGKNIQHSYNQACHHYWVVTWELYHKKVWDSPKRASSVILPSTGRFLSRIWVGCGAVLSLSQLLCAALPLLTFTGKGEVDETRFSSNRWVTKPPQVCLVLPASSRLQLPGYPCMNCQTWYHSDQGIIFNLRNPQGFHYLQRAAPHSDHASLCSKWWCNSYCFPSKWGEV